MKRNLLLLVLTQLVIIGFTQIPNRNLIGYYPFNGNANDESGNNAHGVVFGSQLTSDRFENPNSAYYFDGINDYIEIINKKALCPTDSLTVSGWIKVNDLSHRHYLIDCRYNYDVAPFTSYALLAHNNTSDQKWMTQISTNKTISYTDFRTNSSENTVTNHWYHLAMTYTNNELKLYVDGTLKSINQIANGNLIYTNMPIYIGTSAKLANYTNGIIDDIRIYNAVLNEEEITELFNENKPCIQITEQPQNINTEGGYSADFNVSTNKECVNYQWQIDRGNGFINIEDNCNYSGQKDKKLIIALIGKNDFNTKIRCIISTNKCSVTSDNANLNIVSNQTTIYDTVRVTVYDTTKIIVKEKLVIKIKTNDSPSIENTISIYPNPAKTHVKVNFGDYASMNGYTIKITNTLGKIVYSQLILSQQTEIGLIDYPSMQIYFIQIFDDKNNLLETKELLLE